MDNISVNQFIQQNSPDGGFLQSEEWRQFQEAMGKKTFNISFASQELNSQDSDSASKSSTPGEELIFWANIIEHALPIVGKYFYIPRGPLGEDKLDEITDLARKEKAGWIRIDVGHKNTACKIFKAPHDMQPKEVFLIDLSKSEEELLGEMKSKTRYNVKLAEKKGVEVFETREGKYLDKFLELVKITAKRDGITPHPEEHYRQMLATISAENLKLYVAEYEGKVIVANLVVFYGNTATYLHGASDNEFRNVMAPYLLQWRQIQDAKKAGCTKYDFGGVKTNGDSSWAGITKFKTGFSPNTKPLEFPGSYDIVVNPVKYWIYRGIQRLKSFIS